MKLYTDLEKIDDLERIIINYSLKTNELKKEIEELKDEISALKEWNKFFEENEQKLLNDNLDLIEENGNLEEQLEDFERRYESRCYCAEHYANMALEVQNGYEKEIEELKEKIEVLEGHKLMLQDDIKGLERELFKNKIEIERKNIMIMDYRNQLKD